MMQSYLHEESSFYEDTTRESWVKFIFPDEVKQGTYYHLNGLNLKINQASGFGLCDPNLTI